MGLVSTSSLADLGDSSLWTVSVGDGTTVENNATGDGFTLTGDGADSYAEITRSITASLTRNSFLSFYVVADANFVRLGFALSVAGAAFSKRYEATVHYSSEGATGVKRRVCVPMAKLTAAGGAVYADLADVRTIRLQLFHSSSNTTELEVIGPLSVHTSTVSGAVIIFDDGHESSYTYGLPALSEAGMVGNVAVTPALVNDANYMTTAQLQTLYDDNGWGMVNHSLSHNEMTGLTAADAVAEVTGGLDFLEENSMTRDMNHFVYPGGSWDQTTLDAISPLVRTARLAGAQDYATPGVANMMFLRPYYMTKTIALATVEGVVDRIVERGGIMYLTFHKLVEATSATEDWSIDDFESLVTYMQAAGINTYCPHQLWEGVPGLSTLSASLD